MPIQKQIQTVWGTVTADSPPLPFVVLYTAGSGARSMAPVTRSQAGQLGRGHASDAHSPAYSPAFLVAETHYPDTAHARTSLTDLPTELFLQCVVETTETPKDLAAVMQVCVCDCVGV